MHGSPSSVRARLPRLAFAIAIALSILGSLAFGVPRTGAAEPDVFEQNRRLGRGVNILGYDPIWRDRDQARFREKHFQAIRDAGFQSVRINLHAFRHMEAERGWALRENWWKTLDWAVAQATARGLQVILDLHEFNAMAEDPASKKEKFLAFWRQISAHFRDAPDSVVFEILNEPNKGLTPALWNTYLRDALALIRPAHPNRAVIVGPAFWNSVDHLDELDLPGEDRHLIVTVHFYKPFPFTHQGAPWTNEKDKSGIEWGTDAEREAVRREFAKVNEWARAHRRPVYLGEFGAYDKAPEASRLRYLACVTRTAEDAGWSWGYWQFDSDFILWDMKQDRWVEPILRALVPLPER